MTRVFVEQTLSVGSEITLPPESSRYLSEVLRVRRHERVTLFNGAGGEYVGEITRVDRRALTAKLTEFLDIERESPLHIILAQGISRGERMDYTIQKAVELGVTCIIPLASRRSSVRLNAERAARRLRRWQGIVQHACQQCGRNRIPSIDQVHDIDALPARIDGSLPLLLTPGGDHTLMQLPPPRGPVMLAVGPEGGFDDNEISLLGASGFLNCRLGSRTLRTETAALTAISILQARFGDLGN